MPCDQAMEHGTSRSLWIGNGCRTLSACYMSAVLWRFGKTPPCLLGIWALMERAETCTVFSVFPLRTGLGSLTSGSVVPVRVAVSRKRSPLAFTSTAKPREHQRGRHWRPFSGERSVQLAWIHDNLGLLLHQLLEEKVENT